MGKHRLAVSVAKGCFSSISGIEPLGPLSRVPCPTKFSKNPDWWREKNQDLKFLSRFRVKGAN
jgi:hypothetical protein